MPVSPVKHTYLVRFITGPVSLCYSYMWLSPNNLVSGRCAELCPNPAKPGSGAGAQQLAIYSRKGQIYVSLFSSINIYPVLIL
jgi:hypothetical protein